MLDEEDLDNGLDNKFTFRMDNSITDFPDDDKDYVKKLIYHEIVDWNKKKNKIGGDALNSENKNENIK
jgi:hypothetical protein